MFRGFDDNDLASWQSELQSKIEVHCSKISLYATVANKNNYQ